MKLNQNQLKSLCLVAEQAAKEAGAFIQSKGNKFYETKKKKIGSSLASQVVTEVDIEAQNIILSHLSFSIKHYDLGLLAEESADNSSRLEKHYFWCIDPLDGTLPFTEGRTGYAVSIALVAQSGDPVIGVVFVPDLELCYTSIKENGVYLDDELFKHKSSENGNQLDMYMDQSLKNEPLFDQAKAKLESWAANEDLSAVNYYAGYGAVRNALSVMHSTHGCYFKFPKIEQGGGSIWDFAATRLFFEESGLYVSNAKGNTLHLNSHQTTFMHQQGVFYATDKALADLISDG